MYLVYIVLLPFISSFIAALLPQDSRNREAWLSALTGLTCFVLVVMQTPLIMTGTVIEERYDWIPSLDLSFTFRMDGFAYIFALLVSGMGALISLYARYYMDPADPRPRFYAFFQILSHCIGRQNLVTKYFRVFVLLHAYTAKHPYNISVCCQSSAKA